MVGNDWIVIEGDNGVGKDTLASSLASQGWQLINELSEVTLAKRTAQAISGRGRVEGFLGYCMVCADSARNRLSPATLIRYWPSTIAAAHADGILTWPAAMQRAAEASAFFPEPYAIVELACQHNERVRRILNRGYVEDAIDDLSEERGTRYSTALGALALYFRRWLRVDTTNLNAEDVFEATLQSLEKWEFLQ